MICHTPLILRHAAAAMPRCHYAHTLIDAMRCHAACHALIRCAVFALARMFAAADAAMRARRDFAARYDARC